MKTVSTYTLGIATLSTSTLIIAAAVVFFAYPTYTAMTDDIKSATALASYQTK